MSAALYTGISRSKCCSHCALPNTERKFTVPGMGRLVWIPNQHNAPCGEPCDAVHAARCLLCRTLPRSSRNARPRHKSTVTASAILGQLSALELRVFGAVSTLGTDWTLSEPRWYWVKTRDVKRQAGLRDATTRDCLRKLAARGMLIQNRRSKKWRINLAPKLKSAAESDPA